jgi:hypothetical protein
MTSGDSRGVSRKSLTVRTSFMQDRCLGSWFGSA